MGNSSSSTTGSNGSDQHKEIFVRLLKNEVLQEFADVIIAFVDTNWNPNDEILQGLARLGGNMFVSEWNKIRHQKMNNCQIGDVFCIHSGSLPCRHVLLAVWREGEESETSDIHLKFVVENMLERAKSLDSNVSNIAIPVGCGMNVETHVRILNNVFMWLMPLNYDSVTNIHFLASNEVVEQTLETALSNFKEFIQKEAIEQEQTFETEPDDNETEPDTNEIEPEMSQELETDAVKEVYDDPITEQVPYVRPRYDEYPFNTPRETRRVSSGSSDDGMLIPFKKSVDIFPDRESIWIYYTGSLEVFQSIIPKQKKSVQFEEVASEYDPETGRPVFRTLSQSSVDEVSLHYTNVEPKRKKAKSRRRRNSKTAKSSPSEQNKEEHSQQFFCSICQTTKESSAKQILSKCGHEFCSKCIEIYFSENTPSCPNCKTFYGKPLGDQPNGLMYYWITDQYLPGYPGTNTIVIEYDIPDGVQTEKHPNPGTPYKGTQRTAYIPDNDHGRRVLKLLQKAFDQRIIFTVGKSRTTGKENVVTWNDIHHKTRPGDGPELYGYPDPEYLDRVEEQLKTAGITDDIDDI